uniref:Reverse transcriptase Ty1/copia-type domain-containing protein n=1 Tax=Amphimedon queenslandica TaxID=400682 RepID=A0A1X7U4S9_AMPQE
MQEETNSMHNNQVRNVVDIPKWKRVMSSKRVFKRKIGLKGGIEWYEAHLVAQVIALADKKKQQVHHMDVTTGFLSGELKEEVYLQQTEGFVTKDQKEWVCKLKRSIKGL